jgi:DNA-binding XRE family transcriptional regulator
MLTRDLFRHSVCRVPADPPPDWVLLERRRIGARVSEARMRANLTQGKLCDKSGVDRITLQRIEAGTTDARLSWLLRIAKALDKSVSDLLREE